MQIEYFGGNCVRISSKKVTVVVDDNLESLGLKSITKPDNIVVNTNKKLIKATSEGQFTIDMPGEYEVSNVSVQAVSVRAHTDAEGQKSASMVRLVIEDIRVGVVGHIHPDLSDEQLEALGMIDVLVVPVGGNGYTLDGVGALKVIKKITPKIIVPTHYSDSKLKYEVPAQPLEEALKGLSMEPAETLDELKIRGRDFEENTKLIVLNRQ